MTDQARVTVKLRQLFRKRHLAIMERYYAKPLVDAQKRYHALLEQADAKLRVPPIRAECTERDGAWIMTGLLIERDGKTTRRPLSFPRKVDTLEWATDSIAKANVATPDGTLAALQRDIRAMRKARFDASARLEAAAIDAAKELFGDKATAAALAGRKDPPEVKPPGLLLRAAPTDAAKHRYELLIDDMVDDADMKSVLVGLFAFELVPDGKKGRIPRESQNRGQDKPFQSVDRNFGLVFLLR